MNQIPVLNFQDFIAADGDDLTTTSLHVAAAFGKRHDHVLRDIRALMAELPDEDRLPNFGETVEMRLNPSGGALIPSAVFTISRDGFTLLAMSFTGKKALAFKLAYIKAFNAMAAYIKNQREGLHYQCMAKELECKDSARRGSFHGKGLNQRKQEKPRLESELTALLDQAQKPLRFN
jgi:Rha family phage regulatory protein